MGHGWSVRAYREGDEEGIAELWKAVPEFPEIKYDRERWMRWWHWIYRENPAGNGWIWLAEHDGKIVGHEALIPVAMKVGTEFVTGFQSIDTLTHPEYRRQGIFETLAKKAFAEAAKEGVCIGFGFPNVTSHSLFIRKLNWFDVATLQRLFKPLNWENALRMRISNKFLLTFLAAGGNLVNKFFLKPREAPIVEGLAITQVPHFDDRIDDFWAMVSNQYQIMVVRNKDYLNWRYAAAPDTKYSIFVAEKDKEIYGYLVLRCLQRQHTKLGIIFDMLTQSEQITQCLISKAVEQCQQEKADLVFCTMIANETYKPIKRSGFISIFPKEAFFCAYSSSPHTSREFLADPRNWFVHGGDADVL